MKSEDPDAGEFFASEQEACDVCSGRTDLSSSKTTCSRHFLKLLDDEYQNPDHCAACGWPITRRMPNCPEHVARQRRAGWTE